MLITGERFESICLEVVDMSSLDALELELKRQGRICSQICSGRKVCNSIFIILLKTRITWCRWSSLVQLQIIDYLLSLTLTCTHLGKCLYCSLWGLVLYFSLKEAIVELQAQTSSLMNKSQRSVLRLLFFVSSWILYTDLRMKLGYISSKTKGRWY